MSAIRWINRVLLALLSISTGAVKLAQMEDEMRIFREAGFPDALTIVFGVVQLGGGVLVVVPRTTALGGWVMAPTFVIATGVLLVNGMTTFGVASLLFIAMAVAHARWWRPDN
jgi:uncharacterized membrane protein YphA (DoxX/SURF4 family)